jgi:hypothetical protein
MPKKSLFLSAQVCINMHGWNWSQSIQRLWQRISGHDYVYNSLTCVCDRCKDIKRSSYLRGGCCSRKFKRLTQFMRLVSLKFKYLSSEIWVDENLLKRVCLHAWKFSQIFIQRSNENKSCVEVDTSRLDIPGKERKTLINYIIKIWATQLKVD